MARSYLSKGEKSKQIFDAEFIDSEYHETPQFVKMLTILHIKYVQERFPMQFFTE